jgi:dipeptidyl aminopeptidase/acylaminoacyl peptidase
MADGNSFWYAEGAPENTVIWKVDPMANTKEPLFDTARLRRSLTRILGHEPPYNGVPFEVFQYQEQGEAVRFELESRHFVLRLDVYQIQEIKSPSAEEIDLKTPRTWKGRSAWMKPLERISPDGKWFAGIENRNLYFRSTQNGRTVEITKDGQSDHEWQVFSDSGLWSPNSCYLVIKKVDYRMVPTIPLVHYLEEIERVEKLNYYRSGQSPPGLSLYLVDTPTLGITKVSVDSEAPFLDILAWKPDSSELYLRARSRYENPADRYYQILGVNPQNGSSRVILRSNEGGRDTAYLFLNFFNRQFTILPESNQFLWLSLKETGQELCLYNLDGNLLRELTSGMYSIVEIVSVDEDSRWVYYIARADPERPFDEHLYRVRLDGGNPEQLTQEPGLHSIQFSPSNQYFLDTHSSVQRAPRVELRRANGQILRTLSEADVSRLQELNWTPGEEFVVEDSRQEGEIHGVLYKPANFDPSQKYPLVQFIYPSNRVVFQRSFIPRLNTSRRAQDLAQLGFVTLVIGRSNRSSLISEIEERGQARAETADSASAIRQLAAERPYIDTDRVGIYGSSKGGFFSILAILEAPEVYDVAVSVAGITDMVAHEGNHPFLGPPGTNFEAFQDSSVIHLADRLEGKLLLIHGTGDTAVPISHMMRLAEALIRANKHFDMLIMPEETHSTRNIWAGYGLDAAMRYFVEHLKP